LSEAPWRGLGDGGRGISLGAVFSFAGKGMPDLSIDKSQELTNFAKPDFNFHTF